jgi:putative hydrolase of the HAD superfamily
MTIHPSGALPERSVLALDVDGVLLDPQRAGRGRWQEVLREEYGLDPAHLDEHFFQRSWSQIIVGHEPIEPTLARALTELHWNLDVETLLQIWFDADFVLELEVVRAVDEWAASGVRVVLATNQEARRAGFLEQKLGVILPIGGMASSAALGAVKSDPAFYPAAERSLGIGGRGQRVVLVDDSSVNVDTANSHGWRGVHFDKRLDWRAQVTAALDR